MQRPPVAVWPQLDRIQQVLDGIDAATRLRPEVAAALRRLAEDAATRGCWLQPLSDVQPPAARVRLVKFVHDLGWLSGTERRLELLLVLDELQRREQVGLDEIDLACSLNRDGELDGNFARRVEPGATADLRHAAMRACLGSTEAQRRTLRALETLGRHYLSDRTILDELTKLFVRTPSPEVQAAVAGILIRADRRSLDVPTLLELVRRHRLDGPERPPIIDALVRRLQEP